jgi:ABC-type amino acid transport substrate-binding protein
MSDPYTDVTAALLARDSRCDEFEDVEAIRSHDRLALGVLGDRDLSDDYIRAFLADTPYEVVEFKSISQLLEPDARNVDATVVLAETGMAWSLLHPEFCVVIPRPVLIRRPLAFALAPDADHLGEFVDEWIRLQQARGNTTRAYDYWVLGKGTERREPRWSIARDVLGWIE